MPLKVEIKTWKFHFFMKVDGIIQFFIYGHGISAFGQLKLDEGNFFFIKIDQNTNFKMSLQKNFKKMSLKGQSSIFLGHLI